MKAIPQGRHTREFRHETVRLVTKEKPSLPEAARRLSLPFSTLAYWVKAYKAGKLGEIGNTRKPLTEVEMELARTKKKLVEVKMERDILKKAAAHFARESLHGTRRSDAAPLPHTAPEPNSGGLSQRFLRLDSAVAPPVGKGSNATGGNQGNAQADSGDLWGRETTA